MFSLDYQSRLPIYEQLYKSVTRMAALGAMEKGAALPSVRALAEELGVNPNTVQKAYRMLERDGIVCTVPGKGTFLADGSAALARQRRLAAQGLRAAVLAAQECGMTPDEIVSQVQKILSERDGSE
ncbi:MAG TPA: GntR family transcriptional regulator [Ruminococcaceae bacterium]|jgi:GntR family transcriptional regulator|nr:GntR family transcriptional regulator [Oscillospiraceae bacterium]HBQ46385.1 GntR family transcriptional regulator [Oscillospiraceae bacterium]HBT91461.1 GntR family transcriptional regulator [Oscillospiraceae bacterium]HCB90484.1 GntR family transcriptional regulator [Oscillospiraceae bacterium]